jgi:hypothetical protein
VIHVSEINKVISEADAEGLSSYLTNYKIDLWIVSSDFKANLTGNRNVSWLIFGSSSCATLNSSSFKKCGNFEFISKASTKECPLDG